MHKTPKGLGLTALLLFLSACSGSYESETKDPFAVANSSEGFACQAELRKEGIIGKNQGFSIHTGKGKTTKELNAGETGTYRMTLEEFKEKCAEYGLRP